MANSWELRDWSRRSTANCWHCRRKLRYSDLLSCSENARFLSSHDSWKAVSSGSFELSAMSDGLANARYSFTRLNEWRNESSLDWRRQSSQPHLSIHRKMIREYDASAEVNKYTYYTKKWMRSAHTAGNSDWQAWDLDNVSRVNKPYLNAKP